MSGELPTNQGSKRWRPPTRLGLGGVAIGNGFKPMTDADADATLAAAWDAGVRFFDTSPFYGFGLSERRFGHFLHAQPRDAYALSTKVGRVFTAGQPPEHPLWKDPSPFTFRYDYSGDGVRRSIEDSLQRLGVSRIDCVFVHDLSPDNTDFGDAWKERFAEAAKGAFPALVKLRDEGVIRAWGLGVNRIDPVLMAIEASDPDIFLLATQYSIVHHAETAERVLPALAARDISMVAGAPLEAGFLGGRARYDYGATVPDQMPARRARLEALAGEHGVDLRTVALQFAAAPAEVSAVIPGARTPDQIRSNVDSMKVAIPPAFWAALRREHLIDERAPTPA
ncbi:MAG: aldo/keto reductase [Myxococcales bacterium]|nr:MAG: aldo/keto reductase [Myxococcales bacterium]